MSMPLKKSTTSEAESERMLVNYRKVEEQRRKSYRDFIRSIQRLQPIKKAEEWLKYVANNADNYGDQEALVYLSSRGYDCTENIKKMIAEWRFAERRVFDRRVRGRTIEDINTGKIRTTGGIPLKKARNILNQSTFELPNFWEGNDSQEFSIDATMLRTVEWCKVGGFDEWWARYAKDEYEMIHQGGFEPLPGCFYLFSLVRSEYAIRLMRVTLTRMLESIEICDTGQKYPWCRWKWTKPPHAVENFAYAATIIFANDRIRGTHFNVEIVDPALDLLLRYQGAEGAWRGWANIPKPSIETTAMVVHALAMKKPRGWELAVSAAREWLLSVQTRSGCWVDLGSPDGVYLTVLVLDALELAGGGVKVTFSLSKSLFPENGGAQQKQRKVKVHSMKKIKVLFLSANPTDTDRLSLDEQIRLISGKIRAAKNKDALDLVSVWAVRADDIIQSLNEHKPDMVHFSGHGNRIGQILVVGDD
jgi:hypothetical protein